MKAKIASIGPSGREGKTRIHLEFDMPIPWLGKDATATACLTMDVDDDEAERIKARRLIGTYVPLRIGIVLDEEDNGPH